LNRCKHKKGQEEEPAKKETQKSQRAIVGASLTEILVKRNQKPGVCKAQCEQAIKAAKEKTKALKEILAQRNQKPEVCKAQCEQAIK